MIVFLMYHELELPGRTSWNHDPGYTRYIVPQSAFALQMKWLRQNAWSGFSVSEALRYPAGKSVAITFDDGCETDLTGAAPVLKECGFNATFYITVAFLGRTGYMSVAQLRMLSEHGFEIGCHSMTHAYLDDISAQGLRYELSDAKHELENIVGKRVDHFSCPGGRFNHRVLDVARESGYASVAISRAQANSASTNFRPIGRVAIMRDMDEITFQQICCGAGLWKIRWAGFLREATRTVLGNALYDRFRTFLLGS